jgi:hypothetical protein
LVLNTVFWDYFFADTFLMYVDGVPEWINLPPTSPRPVVLNGYHIGSHVTFQWQIVDDPSFEPFLVFYVPHTTLGNIITDLNAIPLNQIQFGTGDFAPPDGPWGFTIAKITPTNADVCAGFDDESLQFPVYGQTTPALSVPQAGTNTLTVDINPATVVTQVIFRIVDTTLATVTPSAASSATQLVSVAGLATGNAITNTEFRVLGYGSQNTYTTTCSRVAVDILPKRTNVTVALYEIIAATMTNNPPVHAPTQADLKTYLDSVYGTQANVFFNVLPLTTNVVNYDFNGNGAVDFPSLGLSAEESAITGAVHQAGAINIYYVNAVTNPTLKYVGLTYQNIKVTFIGDKHTNSTVNVTAHEIGHSLGLPHPNEPGRPVTGRPDRLMWNADTGSNPCRLVRDEWTNVNKNASSP